MTRAEELARAVLGAAASPTAAPLAERIARAIEAAVEERDAAVADAAAMRVALLSAHVALAVSTTPLPEDRETVRSAQRAIAAALSAPTPGAALLREFERLRAVVEAAGRLRDALDGPDECYQQILLREAVDAYRDALAAARRPR